LTLWITVGLYPQAVRERLGLRWTPRDERLLRAPRRSARRRSGRLRCLFRYGGVPRGPAPAADRARARSAGRHR
ncbi:oxygenase MpaB family protein, partial [Streptomyces bacillaris]